MKKISIRTIVWGFLISASMFSYIYLSVLSSSHKNCPANVTMEEDADEASNGSEVFLPDIALVKKILNVTKIVFPAN